MDALDPDRPTALLPLGQLVRLSVYWLGLVAVVQGIGIILQERITVLVPDANIQYTTLGVLQVAGLILAVLVQPTIGTISDYTVSRFGRRKPYIAIGTVLDLVFLVGLATSNTVLAVAAFVTLLQFSSNLAQGPFQGYVPDLVAAPQVGLASGMVGLFTVLGVVTGTALATIGVATGDFVLPTIALGVVNLATMVILVFRLNEGRAAKDRRGRSWASIAAGAWGSDILRERSFLYLVASRFFLLGGSAFLIVLQVPFLERALGMTNRDQRAAWILGTTVVAVICTAAATIPAARLSQRVGRKVVIYGAAGHQRAGDDDRRARPCPARPGGRRDPRGHRRRQLPRGRLGAPDRHHPQGVSGSVHGHLEHRDGHERRRRRVRRRARHRRLQPVRDARARPARRVPARAGLARARCAAAATGRRAAARGGRPAGPDTTCDAVARRVAGT